MLNHDESANCSFGHEKGIETIVVWLSLLVQRGFSEGLERASQKQVIPFPYASPAS